MNIMPCLVAHAYSFRIRRAQYIAADYVYRLVRAWVILWCHHILCAWTFPRQRCKSQNLNDSCTPIQDPRKACCWQKIRPRPYPAGLLHMYFHPLRTLSLTLATPVRSKTLLCNARESMLFSRDSFLAFHGGNNQGSRRVMSGESSCLDCNYIGEYRMRRGHRV